MVRTGFFISTVYSAVEGFLHERTRKKVADSNQIKLIKSSDTSVILKELSEVIDPSEIPDFLGGQSKKVPA